MLDLYLGKGQHMDLITKFPFSGCDPRGKGSPLKDWPATRESDDPVISKNEEVPILMSAVDSAYEAGCFALAEELDAALESWLEELDHLLSGLDEGGDVLDGDNDVGVEDQFIAAWSYYLAGIGSFSPAEPYALAQHLRMVLREAALKGPYSPGAFVDQASDGELLDLAAELWNERQAWILGTR